MPKKSKSTGCSFCDQRWVEKDGKHKFRGRRKDNGEFETIYLPCTKVTK